MNSEELKNFYNNFLRTAAHKIKTAKSSDLNNLKNLKT